MSVSDLDDRTIADALDVMAHGRATCDRSREIRTYAAGRVTVDLHAREIYSYGRHFPLLRFVPRGRRRRPLIVLNGDEWRNGGGPSRTADHQATARRYAAELGETLVVPFSALTGAGIDIDSIRPLAVRADTNWTETVSVARLELVPSWRRETFNPATGRFVPLEPGADGRFSWDEPRHRLGDCVFSAVREESFTRPARPFERDSESPRELVQCPPPRERYCNAAPAATGMRSDLHEAGPSGACVHCTRPLMARVTVRRRARYLSSFDYNEPRPLYFLAALPRGAATDTVDAAVDSLAPRAVHAARARGADVQRQGDIFFVRTSVDELELAARGIVTRARLTQWTRAARARNGETGYVRPLDADGRRRMRDDRRAEWRRITREAVAKVTAVRPVESLEDRAVRRAARALEWSELAARHELERRAAIAAGYALDDHESAPCMECGARIGEECRGREGLSYRSCWKRETLERLQRDELEGFRNGAGRSHYCGTGPSTMRGARAQWVKQRAEHAAAVAAARAQLRRSVFGADTRYRGRRAYAYHRESQLQAERRELAQRVREARRRLDELVAAGPRDANGSTSRAHSRDVYRRPFRAPVARAAWTMADSIARARAIPHEHDGPTIERRRELVRRALAIYGTAHAATEVVRTRAGAVYVRGTVRHVPELEPGRTGEPDHVRLELEPGAWYLAVRNTVPRARARRTA